jgi:hypothetical protein
MTEHMSGDPDAGGLFVRLDDGDMHVVADGKPAAPALLLIHSTGASTAWWDPVVPRLAGAYRVIRVDLPGHGRSSSPAGGYDIPTQARRVGAELDRLGAGRVTVIGHSTGGSPRGTRRSRRAAAGRGSHPDAGRPPSDRQSAAGLRGTRRAPQLTAPRYRRPRSPPDRTVVQ